MIYRVLLNGQNFLLDIDGIQKFGFYTTRDVEADSPENAENKAVTSLKTDEYLKTSVFNEKSDSPMIFVEDLRLLENDGEKPAQFGFTFYKENDEDEK